MEKMNLHREIKSFVLRQGKITLAQQRAFAELMPKYGIEYQAANCDLVAHFGRQGPKVVEIGFGMGDASWQIAQANPQVDYLGIEVHMPGVGSLLLQLEEHQINNLRVIRHDAVEVLRHMLADASIDGFHIYFPDPWHKQRHHKRRIIQAEFVALLVAKLKPGAYLHLATDWEDYARWMLAVLSQNSLLQNQSVTADFVPRPSYRPLTKFEKRGLNLGHAVWDLLFHKKVT